MKCRTGIIRQLHNLILSAAVLCVSSTAFSAASNLHGLLDLSVEELTKVKASVASRKEENVNFAAGNVSVYTHQEIEAFGGRNLRDVLDRLTGIQVITSHVFPQHKLSMRGVNSGINDTSVLVLINGNPIKNANGGGSSGALYNGISLVMIDRIEVIRGPGSVLYGSNAFAGVINLVTKTRDSAGSLTHLEASVGSFDSRGLDISSLLSGQDHNILLGANLEKSNGESVDNITDRFANTGTYHSGFDQTALMASGNIGRISFTGLYTDFAIANGGGLFKLVDQEFLDEKKYLAIGYEQAISKQWNIKLSYLYNEQILQWQINNPANAEQVSDSTEQVAEVYLQGNITEAVSIIAGSSYSALEGSVKFGFPTSDIWRRSYFSQASIMASPNTKVVAGFQWNKPEESTGDLSSRLGLVQQFGEHWWWKLSYGEAFRSPFSTEIFVVSPGLVGNPELKPEQIKTYESQLIYEDTHKRLGLSLYKSKQSETISRAVLAAGSPPTFINRGVVDYQGVEIEGKVSLTERLLLTFNASYQTSETDTGLKDDSFAPNEMIKAGFAYGYSNSLTVSVFNRYIGASTDLNKTKGIALNNPLPEAYNLLTANLIWDLGLGTKNSKKGATLLTLYLDNILDEDVFAPDVINQGTNNSLPSHYGFNASISLSHHF